MMQLYYMPGASSLADHIVLEWVGAPYDAVKMSPESLKSPAYLALNPRSTVPLLRHGDFLLTENVAILHYLAELHPEAALMGGHSPGAEFKPVDHAALARAAGCRAVRIEDPSVIAPALRDALAANGPVLLDVIVDPDAVPPINGLE